MEGAYWWTSLLNNQPVISGPAVINKISPCPTFSLYSFHFVIFLLIFFFLVYTLKMAGGRPGGTTGNNQVPPNPPTPHHNPQTFLTHTFPQYTTKEGKAKSV